VPFLDNANRMYQKRFCFSQTSSGVALTVTYIVAAVFSAPLGLLIDKFGYKRYFIMTSLAISTLAQLIILLIPQCINGLQVNGAIAGLFFIGLGYCFYGNCILPAIPLVVKKKVTGTAFGIMQMIESIALAFFPLITGAIVENSSSVEIGYRYSELFFVLIGVVGIIVSMGLFFVPDKIKKKLDRISKDKLVIQRIEGETIYSASDTDQTSP
jgi:MFS family permease